MGFTFSNEQSPIPVSGPPSVTVFDGESSQCGFDGDISAADISAIFSPSFMFSPEQKAAQGTGPKFPHLNGNLAESFCGIASVEKLPNNRLLLNESITTQEDDDDDDDEDDVITAAASQEDGDCGQSSSSINDSLLQKLNACEVANATGGDKDGDGRVPATSSLGSKRKRFITQNKNNIFETRYYAYILEFVDHQLS